jgi:hypothetical protein
MYALCRTRLALVLVIICERVLGIDNPILAANIRPVFCGLQEAITYQALMQAGLCGAVKGFNTSHD